MSEEEIREICRKYDITNWIPREDGTVDVNVDVDLSDKRLSSIPLKFGKVKGNFNCEGNNLIDLKGCPTEVTGNFNCRQNRLTTLYGGPSKVGGGFNCKENKLTDLKFSPDNVGVGFNCSWNEIKILEGFNTNIEGKSPFGSGGHLVVSFMCHGNPIGSIFDSVNQDFLTSFKVFKVLKGDVVNVKRLRYVMSTFNKPVRLADINKYYKVV